ncbi:EAL domain-containing protein [Halanaerobiaceae bacterium Z-7014]|uniref:EAL domain-containing protein n=1 Tax=Halonatronomonas betaini TaxID=2778430 RepID=A0A931AU12_9FIRM|nr:EAL domain-containing protein [Halonatronomonas betaini]MBF8436141.1 EAL domain-containing protein [Halonatronomonas betaini]
MAKNNEVKWYNSLLLKINWSIIFLLIIFIAVLSIVIRNYVSEQVNNQIESRNTEIADSLEYSINDFIRNKERILALTRQLPELHTGEREEVLPVLSAINQEYQNFKYLYLGRPDGEMIIYPEIEMPAGYIPGERDWYQSAVNRDSITWTDSYYDANENYLMITTAIPVRDENNQLLGVLGGDIVLEDLSQQVADKGRMYGTNAFITDASGKFIAHDNQELILNQRNINEILDYTEIINNQSGYIEYQGFNGDEKIAFYNRLSNPEGVVFVESSINEVFAIQNRLENIILISSIVVSILLIVSVFLINKKYLLKPINNLINTTRMLADGDFSAKIKGTKDDELGKLATNFNYMTDELAAAYQQLEANNEEITYLNQNLEYQANHDPLTDLANWRKFMKELNSFLEEKSNKEAALIFLDINNFKEINDTLGHVNGDLLLKEFSKTLSQICNENRFLARYGGDEFLILVKNTAEKSKIEALIQQLYELISESFIINENKVYIDLSIGISRYPMNSEDSYQLVTMADTAMYQAKESIDKNHLYYQEKMRNRLETNKKIKEILREALENDGFKLVYQPQVNLRTGRAEYFEALLRLKNYNISPGKFIPVAESSGLINEIGRWVTEETIKELAELNQESINPIKISINFSVKQLHDAGYIDFLEELLKEYDLNPGLLEIEITESILIKAEDKAIEFLNKISDLGVKLALDDFGNGYSSLKYLSFINFDKIKVDRHLGKMFLDNDQKETMASLINLFHSMGLPVVAEGVEELVNYNLLKNLKCDFIQGYLFSRPVGRDKLTKILNHNFIKDINL